MTVEEIKAFLATNKDDAEVKAFMAEINPEHVLTADEVTAFMDTDDGRALVQPRIDQAVTKAVKTRDKAHADIMEKELKSRLAAELLKANPEKSPLELKVIELEEANRIERAERQKDNLKRQLVEEAAKMGINPFFIDDYMPESFEVGKLYLQKIANYTKEVNQKTTNELLASGYKPGAGNEKSGSNNKVDFKQLSQADVIKMELEGTLDDAIKS